MIERLFYSYYCCCHKLHILLKVKGRIKNGEKEKKGKKKKDRKKANGVTEFPPLLTIKQPSAVVIAAKFHSIIPPFFPFVQSSRVETSRLSLFMDKEKYPPVQSGRVSTASSLAEKIEVLNRNLHFSSLASSSSLSSSRKEAGHDPPIFLPSLADGSYFPTMMSRFLFVV